MIKIRNLSYVYSPGTPFAHRALDGINLDIEDGEFFGIVGETGSGKSTLINHINALTRVQKKANVLKLKKGADPSLLTELSVAGMDLTAKKPDLKKLRESVGMVFQYPEYQLFADSVLEDVCFGPKNLGLDREECVRRAESSLALTGIDPGLFSRSPFELSGGQKRRVAIAGVLAMRPDILVLDEPTAGLDPEGKRDLTALLKKLKETVSVIIMVSHNMDEIAECCSRVAVLSEGKVRGVFTPAALFSDGELIRSLGLELPVAVEAAETLRASGVPVRPGVLTEEELLGELVRIRGGDA